MSFDKGLLFFGKWYSIHDGRILGRTTNGKTLFLFTTSKGKVPFAIDEFSVEGVIKLPLVEQVKNYSVTAEQLAIIERDDALSIFNNLLK